VSRAYPEGEVSEEQREEEEGREAFLDCLDVLGQALGEELACARADEVDEPHEDVFVEPVVFVVEAEELDLGQPLDHLVESFGPAVWVRLAGDGFEEPVLVPELAGLVGLGRRDGW